MKNSGQLHIAVLGMLGCLPLSVAAETLPSVIAPKNASGITQHMNAQVLKDLPFSDMRDFENARRGFVATLPDLKIMSADGSRAIWDMTRYGFIKGDAPDTVNPSLWRIAQLNSNNGLFKVVDRVYQIRGYDLSNMTIIEGDTGLILIDPLISPETSKAGLELYRKNRGDKPVVAVIYTHSHVDHYGGVKGVIDEADVKAGKVKVIAPAGFLEEAISENIYAGNAMARRALYQYGGVLPPGPRGQVDSGLGVNTSMGMSTLIAPTDIVLKTGDTRMVDGVKMEFQMAPGTEAPAEFLIYFPQFRVLNMAEDATHTLHNLYTLRGAQARDARTWWKVINTAIESFGTRTDAVIAQHHWPTWGDRVVPFLQNQRNGFKYIHDQSLNLANKGLTMVEIAETIELPDGIGKVWENRGYYGSVNHNAKAVYQRYLGWYDSNPAHLHNLPPTEAGTRYVEFMGGADAVITKAKAAYDAGDYRWVAEVVNHIVFADPSNKAARALQADALEQLGYQQENPTWRNEYLMGAFELRNGVPKLPPVSSATPDAVRAMPTDMLLDYMGIRLDAKKSAGKHLRVNWEQPGGDRYALELVDSVLIYTKDKQFSQPDASLTMSKDDFAAILMGNAELDRQIKGGKAKVNGRAGSVQTLFASSDTFEFNFNIVEP